MRLVSCHIENFGRLSDFTHSFDSADGMKVICENNGWGKSTLATFIKVMFYGFDNEGRRSAIENERQHYRPWQGGVYGGQLTFEAGEKTYIMSRTFGAKEKDDKFMLQDAGTKLESTDFSSNIGEELFQIDRASFLRSIYISQNDCVTAATDSINSKLGNLTDNTNDLNNYETADKKITDMLNALSGARKTGILYKQKEQIAALKQEIKSGEGIDASMEELLRLKSDLCSSYNGLKKEQGILQEKQREISEYKDIAVKKNEYDHLCSAEEKSQRNFNEKKAFFKGIIPKEDEIDEYIRLESNTAGLKKEIDIYELNHDEEREFALQEERFAQNVPDASLIEIQNDKIDRMQTLRQNIEKEMLTDEETGDLQQFEEMFAKGAPSKETIAEMSDLWRLRTDKKNMLGAKTAAADMLELTAKAAKESYASNSIKTSQNAGNMKTGRKLRLWTGIILFAMGIACVAAGLLADFMIPLIAGGALALIAGIIFMMTGLSAGGAGSDSDKERTGKTEYGKDKEYADNVYDTSEEPGRGGVDSYMALRKEIAGDEALISHAESEILQFLSKYGISYEENSAAADIYRLGENASRYERLRQKSQNADAEQMRGQYETLLKEAEDFLHIYGFAADCPKTVHTAANEIYSAKYENDLRNDLRRLENAAGRYVMMKEKSEKYKKAYDAYAKNTEIIKGFICGLKMEPMQDMHAQLQDIKTMRREYNSAFKEYEQAQKNKKEFEDKHEDIEKIKYIAQKRGDGNSQDNTASLTGIEARLSEISEAIEKNRAGMASYDRQLSELQEEKDLIADSEKKLEELQETYADNEKKQRILKKTQKYLEQAKVSLTARYTKPIKDGFDKYFNILAGIGAQNYQLDANLEISVIEQGLPRNTGFLSSGYRDMVGICMRMALIDAMYKEEKPFIIFDDPFVNLDDDKTTGAMTLLNLIAKEYQIIYFTCHGKY